MKRQLEEDIKKPLTDNEDDEILSGENCQICGYPIVIEYGLEVCYKCGWSGEKVNDNNI